MSARHVAFTTADEVERHAFESGQPIECDPHDGRIYCRIGNTTFISDEAQEPPC